MRANTYETLLRELAAIDAPPEAKRQFAEILRRNAARDGIKVLERQNRVEYARHLLDLRLERPIICERLMLRFSIGESTAYRDIDKALQIDPNSGGFWDW